MAIEASSDTLSVIILLLSSTSRTSILLRAQESSHPPLNEVLKGGSFEGEFVFSFVRPMQLIVRYLIKLRHSFFN
ncbi:hypothetical protein MTYM_00018 [Methylococcales bacterium]|nr:hypothetical protein MTYM_00018 [Methylococcales bacterium]